MNERIEKLAEHAWTLVSDEEKALGGLYEADRQRFRRDVVFAELIINECLGMIIAHEDDAPEEFHELWVHMKQHFGIK